MTFEQLTKDLLSRTNCYLVCKGFHVADLHDFVEVQKATIFNLHQKGINPKQSRVAIDSKKHLKQCYEALQDKGNIYPLGHVEKKFSIYPLLENK